MKIVTRLSTLCLFFLFSATIVFSQNRPENKTIGISASFQGNQTNLSIPIWTSESVVVAPIIGLVHEEDSFTTLNVGVKPRFYRTMGSDFASYLGFQGLLQYTSPETGDGLTNFIIGANGGGEYFLDDHFSLGVEGQLNFFIRDSNENGLSTAAAIVGTYYF